MAMAANRLYHNLEALVYRGMPCLSRDLLPTDISYWRALTVLHIHVANCLCQSREVIQISTAYM